MDLTAVRNADVSYSGGMTRQKMFIKPGDRYGRGVVIEEVRVPQKGVPNGVRGARLQCDCGNTYTTEVAALFRGRTTSCGCRHLDAFRETRARTAAAADPAGRQGKVRQYREDHHDQIRAQQRQYYLENQEARSAQQRQYRADTRAAVFAHYGTSCTCCGSAKKLVLDHVNGDGVEHRMKLFGARHVQSTRFYRWVIDNGYPDWLQALCHRCNTSKAGQSRCRLDHAKDGGG